MYLTRGTWKAKGKACKVYIFYMISNYTTKQEAYS